MFPNNSQRTLAGNFLAKLKAQNLNLEIHNIDFSFNENVAFIYGENDAQRQALLEKICAAHGCSGYIWTKGFVVLNFGTYENPTFNSTTEQFRNYPALEDNCSDHYVLLNKTDMSVVDENFNHVPFKQVSPSTHFKKMYDLVQLGHTLWEQHNRNPKKRNLQKTLQSYQFAVVNNFGVVTPIIDF